MSRGVAVAEWLAGAPDAIVVLAAMFTQLGDLWFLWLVLVTLYWLGPATPLLGAAVDRDRVAVLLALLLLAVALVDLLKAAFALPRPPLFADRVVLRGVVGPLTPIYGWLAGAEGFGFPSGHAFAATVGWGGLAWAVRVGRRRTRYVLAGTVVAVVGLTRLVLGVHYLVDVIAGAALGLALLAAVVRVRSPTITFALAAPVAVGGLALTGLTTDAAGTVGLAVGGGIGWWLVGRSADAAPDRTAAARATVLGLLVLGPTLVVAAVGPVPPSVTLLLAAAGGVGIVAVPSLAARIAR